MTEPKTNQQLNAAVAKKLGLEYWEHEFAIFVDGWCVRQDGSPKPFAPATDPAAALWALNKLCDDRAWAWATFRNRPNSAGNPKRFGCVMGPNEDLLEHCDIEDWYATIEEAICWEIVGAAE